MSPFASHAKSNTAVPRLTPDGSASGATVASAVPSSPAARWAGWLMALSPLYFVALVVANIAVLTSAKIGLYTDITRSQMDELGLGWVLINVLFPLAVVAGVAGCALAALSLGQRKGAGSAWARASAVCAALAILGMLPYAPFRVAAMGFTEPTLGGNKWYSAWDTAGMFAFGLAIAALALLCAAMYFSGVRRAAAMAVGVLAVAYGIATLALVPLPPFIIAFLWLALGIAWLRGMPRIQGGPAGSGLE